MPFARREKQLKRLSLIKMTAFFGVVAFCLIVILTVENMLLSSILAFVLSYLLGPLVNYLERAGIQRVWATTASFLLAGAVLSGTILALTPFISLQINTLKLELPKYIHGITRLMADTEERLQALTGALYSIDLSEQVESFLVSSTTTVFEGVPAILTQSLTVMLLAPFLAFFMIKDGRHISKGILSLVPNTIFELTLNLHHQINEQMGHFVRARLLEAAIVGMVTWIGLTIIDFPFAALLALFAALTNLIPYIGPIIGAIPAVLIALINAETAFGLFLVTSVYFVAQIIDAAFIIPLVVAKIVDLHPVTVMVAIIIGAQVMGVLGMLISIPVASALKVTLSAIYRHLTDFRA